MSSQSKARNASVSGRWPFSWSRLPSPWRPPAAEDRGRNHKEEQEAMDAVAKSGLNSTTAYAASMLSVLLSILLWLTRRGNDRANAERFGIFVGLWAPTLAIFGKVLEDRERRPPEAS